MFKKILTVVVVLMFAVAAYASPIEKTLLDAVVASGASSAINTGEMETKTVTIIAADVSSGATIAIQTSHDGTNFVAINTQTIAADGTTEVAIVGLFHKYIRANITSYTDGTYTVYLFGKQ